MRKLFMLGAVLAVMAIPTASHAGGFTLGLRLGYAGPVGDGAKDQPMSDVVAGAIPFQVDGLYRVTPQIAVGGYLSYGFGMLNSDLSDSCDAAGIDCSVSQTRIGIEGTYTFTQVSGKFVPWAGIGIGYEWLTQEMSVSGLSASADAGGWEYANLQVGGDYMFSKLFGLGPYVTYSFGQYNNVEGSDIPEKAMHSWWNIGVRGKFDFGAK